MSDMDLKNKADFSKLKNIKKVFFYRVCGVGMGATACLLKEKGLKVAGADTLYAPPMGDYLKSMGIECLEIKDLTDEYLKRFDLIVVGNVVPGNSDEARRIENLGVPFSSFPETLGKLILNDINVIGISGTHGKTTTTYLMAQIFENLGEKPGYFIGGVIADRPSSALGDGKYFFIEADEYDSAYFEKISKFRLYSINHLVCTSLEFDHADIFNSIEDIKYQFKALIPSVEGSFIWNTDYEALGELKNEYSNKTITAYGENSKIGPRYLDESKGMSRFALVIDNKEIEFQTNLVGKHNILNLTTCILFALDCGFKVEKIKNAILDLKMVKRRQEERGYFNKALIIDDFAHHPRAVEVTLDAIITKYPRKTIHVIIEPQSATARSSIFQKEFADSLIRAGSVMVAKPSKPTTVKNSKDLDCHQLVEDINKKGTQAKLASNPDELFSFIEKSSQQESVILILSNGTCMGLWQTPWAKNLKLNV